MNVNASYFKAIDPNQGIQEAATEQKSSGDLGFNKIVKSYLKEPTSTNIDNTKTKTTETGDGPTEVAKNENDSEGKSNTVAVNAYLKNITMEKAKTNTKSVKSPSDILNTKVEKKVDKNSDEDLMSILQGLLNSINEILNSKTQDTNLNTAGTTTTTGDATVASIKTKSDLKLLLNKLNSFLKLVEDKAMGNIKTLEGQLGLKDSPEKLLKNLQALTEAIDPTNAANSELGDEGSQKLMKLLFSNLNTVKQVEELRAQLSSKPGNEDNIKKLLNELLSGNEGAKTQSTKGETVPITPSKNEAGAQLTENKPLEVQQSSTDKEKSKLTEDLTIHNSDKSKDKTVAPITNKPVNTETGTTATSTIMDETSSNIKDFKDKLVELITVLSKDDTEMKALPQSIKTEPKQKLIKLLDNIISKEVIETSPKLKTEENPQLNKDNKQQFSGSNKDNSSDKTTKEDKFLKNVLGEAGDTKVNKVNVFMAQIKSEKDNVVQLQSLDKPVINKNNLTQDIIKVVKYMSLNDLKELTVKITPKELGDIVIKISVEAGNMKANISANTKETFNLLSSKLEELTNSLKNNDIKIQSSDINIYQEDSTYFNGGSREEGQRQNNQRSTASKDNGSIDEISLPENVVENENNLSILV